MNSIEQQITELLDQFRKDCFLAKELDLDDRAVRLLALSIVNTRTALVNMVNAAKES